MYVQRTVPHPLQSQSHAYMVKRVRTEVWRAEPNVKVIFNEGGQPLEHSPSRYYATVQDLTLHLSDSIDILVLAEESPGGVGVMVLIEKKSELSENGPN